MSAVAPLPVEGSDRRRHRRQRQFRGVTFIVSNMLLLVAMTALDVRDIIYKTMWIGPYDSFKFDGTGDHLLSERRLIPSQQPNSSGQILERASGWSSFFDVCSELHATSFFLSSMGINCTIGSGQVASPVVIPKLVITGTIRVDSVAWASCTLLFYHRRPAICQELMVTQFLRRYRIEAPRIGRAVLAAVGSTAEAELLHLLSIISSSAPLHKVVCVEAFQLQEPGLYHPSIFGCGSPNVFLAAFAGVHASSLRSLLGDKTWLTLDEMDFLGLQFAVRQNDISDYKVRVNGEGITVAAHHPVMNYSSSGPLYPIVILCDLIDFMLHLASSLQVLHTLLLPQLKYYLGYGKSVPFFRGATWLSMVSRSLYRSQFVSVIVFISQAISWQLIMPNAVIWSWSLDGWGRWQAILSSLRSWVLILICFIWLWDLFVIAYERLAYTVAARTFVSTIEVAAVCILVAYWRRADLLSISNVKYARDRQRLTDTTSFVNAVGYSNSYDDSQRAGLYSDSKYWTIVYLPLVRLTLTCLGFVFALLLVKWCYLTLQRRFVKHVADSGESHYYGLSVKPIEHHLWTLPEYERLPVEILLNTPIRAKNVLRSRLAMELKTSIAPVRHLYASLYFDHGIIVNKDRKLVTRYGFFSPILPCIDLESSADVKGMEFAITVAKTQQASERLPFSRVLSSNLFLAGRRASLRFIGQSTDRLNKRTAADPNQVVPIETTTRLDVSEPWAQRRSVL